MRKDDVGSTLCEYCCHVSSQMFAVMLLRPKKNIVCFRFSTDPIKTCATQIYFMDFQKKKKKKKKFFFFFFFRRFRS